MCLVEISPGSPDLLFPLLQPLWFVSPSFLALQTPPGWHIESGGPPPTLLTFFLNQIAVYVLSFISFPPPPSRTALHIYAWNYAQDADVWSPKPHLSFIRLLLSPPARVTCELLNTRSQCLYKHAIWVCRAAASGFYDSVHSHIEGRDAHTRTRTRIVPARSS